MTIHLPSILGVQYEDKLAIFNNLAKMGKIHIIPKIRADLASKKVCLR